MEQPEWHDLGALVAVTTIGSDEGGSRWTTEAVRLALTNGSVLIEAVPIDDTIRVSHPAAPRTDLIDPSLAERDATGEAPWAEVIGRTVTWGRFMVNHHGYVDGYQMEFATDAQAVGPCVELVTVASRLVVGSAEFE